MQDAAPLPSKNPVGEHPVAASWRPVFEQVVRALIARDYTLSGIAAVVPADLRVAVQMREYLADYGEALVELRDETWASSVALWMSGHWEVIVDLWTRESGRSDLVLHARVSEQADGFAFRIKGIWVP